MDIDQINETDDEYLIIEMIWMYFLCAKMK